MGRTNPTYRDALRSLERAWKPMRRALRRGYQRDFDRLFDRARSYADAAGHANATDPEHALFLSLLLAHEAEIRRLHERVDELEGARQADGTEPGAPPTNTDTADDDDRDVEPGVGTE